MNDSPTLVAWLALLSIVPLSFLAFWRWAPRRAALTIIFGSAMFLPCHLGFEVPILPNIDKEILPSCSALAACLVFHRRALRARPFRGPEALLLLACAGAVGTMLTNQDVLVYGPTQLPAQTWYDAFTDCVQILLTWFAPFYLGRALFRNASDLRELLRFIVMAGLLYSLFIVVELRLSPQWHNWLYGYHQSHFLQTIRFGGYRPKVFMRHGLNVALFMLITTVAAAGLWRAKSGLSHRLAPAHAVLVLLVILVALKSTGVYFYAAALIPLTLFASPRIQQLGLATIIALIVGYPLARGMEWFPVEAVTDWMTIYVNQDRALSLWFRMFTEGQILDNVKERLIFGWGGYGRAYEFDPATGEMLSVLDGYWTIELGEHGLVGWSTIFGLILLPLLGAVRALNHITASSTRALVAALALMGGIYVFDWVPNSSISAELTFMVGALAGVVPGIIALERRQRRAKGRLHTVGKRGHERPPSVRAARAATP